MYVVHRGTILSVVFCVFCSLWQILVVIIWWKRTQVWVCNGVLCCEYGLLLFYQVVDMRALSNCIVLRAFAVVVWYASDMCVWDKSES